MEAITDGMRDDDLVEVDPCLSLVQECLEGLPAAQRALFNHLLPRLKSAVQEVYLVGDGCARHLARSVHSHLSQSASIR